MRTVTKKSGVEVPSSKAETGKAPDIASAPVPDTLAALRVDPETGLTRAEVDARRKEHGYNEVTGHKDARVDHDPVGCAADTDTNDYQRRYWK
jgi:hypothetical protein